MENDEITLGSLEKKVWFRWLKVLYIISLLGFLSITLIFVLIIYPEKIVDNNQTTIICDIGNKKEFNAAKEMFKFSYAENTPNNVYFSPDDAIRIRHLCEITDSEGIGTILAHKEIFEIKPVIKSRVETFPFFLFLCIPLLSIVLFFEILKRIFYYILTGKIMPKK